MAVALPAILLDLLMYDYVLWSWSLMVDWSAGLC